MFKVSLLPESYRKKLIGKKNKDIILSVALVVLMCMLIVYAGFVVKLLILKNQTSAVAKRNAELEMKIEELRPYIDSYNQKAVAEANIKNIKPVDITALEMVNIVQNLTPNYVQITAISAPDWQNKQIMVIEGNLSAANSLGTAISMLDDYQKIILENEEIKDKIVSLKVVNDAPIVNANSATNEKSYSFRIIVSLYGSINIDQQTGTIITTVKPEVTTAAPESTAAAETDTTIAEANTIA